MKLFIIVLVFILLDCVTGILTAVKNNEVNSTKMRSGFFNKSAFVLIVIVAIFCDYAMSVIDIGLNPHLFQIASGYVAITELISIIENLGNLNSKLVPNDLKKMFLKIGSDK